MGLFDKLFKKPENASPPMQEDTHAPPEPDEEPAANSALDAAFLLEQHENGAMDAKAFLQAFANVPVFYSTPFGEHKDGGNRLFVLPEQDGTAYLPAFTSAERATEFYNRCGRLGFLIMEGSFASVVETTKKINLGDTPVKLGVVIEPDSYGVTVGADILDIALEVMK